LVLKTKKYCHFLKLVNDFSCKTMDPKDPRIFFLRKLESLYQIMIYRNHNPHVEQELNTVPEHLSTPPIFSWFRAARSLVFCLMIWRSLIVLLSFSLGHCIVCPSIYCFWAYPWSFVTQILRNGQPSHGDDRNTFEVTTST
jgi:hypothetical protein